MSVREVATSLRGPTEANHFIELETIMNDLASQRETSDTDIAENVQADGTPPVHTYAHDSDDFAVKQATLYWYRLMRKMRKGLIRLIKFNDDEASFDEPVKALLSTVADARYHLQDAAPNPNKMRVLVLFRSLPRLGDRDVAD